MTILSEATPGAERRHDLDALRAWAMLLGIGLHAALSFFPAPWPAQDSRQSELFGLFLAVVHGFRMPLFFLISGYFTMMLYRKRGLGPMLRQRALRILVPCLLGLATIVPLVHLASAWAMSTTGRRLGPAGESLVSAIRAGDRTALRKLLEADADAKVDQPDPALGITPLSWAAMKGDVESVTLLIDHGADLNKGNRDGSTPLHGAAFLGREEVAEILLERDADPLVRNGGGERAIRSTYADWGITTAVVNLIGLPQPDRKQVEKGRARVRDLLAKRSPGEPSDGDTAGAGGLLPAYRALLDSDLFEIHLLGVSFHLINTSVFEHLWFLWFLCWLVALFGLAAWAAQRLKRPRVTTGRLMLLVPLTFLPQWFMGSPAPGLGPDTAAGLLPPPHILAYYLIFFAFGAFTFDADDRGQSLGRRWWALLPFGLFVALPVALGTLAVRPLTAAAQVVYVWSMSFALMGLFRARLNTESRPLRYLSDASYWLYLTHLPLVIAAQAFVSGWPLPAIVKFTLICVVVTGLLLLVYAAAVRYSWLGTLLNGPRKRPERQAREVASAAF